MDPAQQFPFAMEALRRQQGMGASGAGIPGGAPAANSPAPANPIAQQGMTPPPQVPQGQPAGGGSPFATSGAAKALSGALPGEATMILQSLTKTLDRITKPQPQTPFG